MNGLHSTYFIQSPPSEKCVPVPFQIQSNPSAHATSKVPPGTGFYKGLEVVGTVGFCGLLYAAGAHSSGTMLMNLAMPWSVLSSLMRYRLLSSHCSAASRGICNMLNVLEVIDFVPFQVQAGDQECTHVIKVALWEIFDLLACNWTCHVTPCYIVHA